MQENNFEKQVQDKMDELKIRPSEELWQKVSLAITKRKTDRRVFIIIFLFLLLIGSGALITWNQITNGKINKTVAEKTVTDKTTSTNQASEDKGHHQIIDESLEEKMNTGISTHDQQRPETVAKSAKSNTSVIVKERRDNDIVDANTVKKRDNKKSGKIIYKSKPVINVVTLSSNPEDENVALTATSPDSNQLNVEEAIVFADRVVNEPVTDTAGKKINDVIVPGVDNPKSTSPADEEKKTVTKNATQIKQKDPWKLGFNFSAGGVAMQDGVLGLGNSDASKAYANLSPITGGGTGSVSNPPASPSSIKPGAGIVLGVFVQKNISPKMNLLFGLNYKRYSSSIMVGSKVDSNGLNNMYSNIGSYRPGNSSSYKNNFHFIELPAVLQFRLSKQNKLPVYIFTGLTIAQLVGSNALQFTTQPASYYADNDLLNKTQVNVSAGLLFSLSRHSKNPVLLGPDINFSLSTMANSGLYKDRHYSYLGIVLRKTVGKN